MPTSECFARLCFKEIPGNLPEARRTQETQECCSSRLEQTTEVLTNRVQVFNAIERGKIRKDTVEWSILLNRIQVLRGQQTQIDGVGRHLSNPPRGYLKH